MLQVFGGTFFLFELTNAKSFYDEIMLRYLNLERCYEACQLGRTDIISSSLHVFKKSLIYDFFYHFLSFFLQGESFV